MNKGNKDNKRKGYKNINTYIIMLSIVLVIMWAVGFTNEIDYV